METIYKIQLVDDAHYLVEVMYEQNKPITSRKVYRITNDDERITIVMGLMKLLNVSTVEMREFLINFTSV